MRHRRRRHRNPLSVGGLVSTLKPAAFGAAGALVTDVAWNYLSPYVPASLVSNQYLQAATKIAMILGLGMLGRKFVGAGKVDAAITGAVTVELYSAASFALSGVVPGLSGMGAYLRPAGMGAYSSPNPAVYLNGPRMGAYMGPRAMSANMAGLGFLGGLGGMPGAMPGSFSTENS